MNKREFLAELRNALRGLPQDDMEERIAFYDEMIDDRMEEGLSEEEAVAQAGSVDDIVAQTVADIPFSKLVRERIKPKHRLDVWKVVLIVLGFPVWLPLLIAACAVLLSLYVVLWVFVICLWAIEVSLWACALGGIVVSVIYFAHGYILPGGAMLGIGLFCAGISVFLFLGCIAASKGILRLTKKAARRVKSLFLRKESAE